PHPSSLIPRLRRAMRGRVDARAVALEAWRRSRAKLEQRRERARLEQLAKQPARLRAEFARMPAAELLDHFRQRNTPKFFSGFDSISETANSQRALFPSETAQLIESATRIANKHMWPLLGYGEKSFGAEINWHLDPVSGKEWSLLYHADIALLRGDGSDVRVLWELNRLGHLITLSRAYAVTKDERFAADFFSQVRSWRKQNMVGRGANWACAMEVALRAMNLLAAFALFRHSSHLTEETLAEILSLFDQHGAHIFRNLEFSYISTSNHYLSDVVGLLWLGLMLPELEAAQEWRAFGLGEMLCEMDKQILSDGADFESSTGYHRFILELLLYSFLLCRENKIEIEEKYWRKLRAMLEYVCAYLRPDGRAPLIGDTDGGRALPLTQRDADDHAYLLALGASVFQEARFRQTARNLPEELLWLLGERGVREFENLEADEENAASQSFKDAGTFVLREGDLYLLFNASGNGMNGRGSHAHNDALSIEVSACGRAFLVDPGTYVYTSNLNERHLFRSTAYHSTVLIDGAEQNETQAQMPFVIGDEAHPHALHWETTPEYDRVAAEHDGYRRLTQPVTHRRAVRFDKRERFWLIEDAFTGEGEHTLKFRFHFDTGLDVSVRDDATVSASDETTSARLIVAALDLDAPPLLEQLFTSRNYGEKQESVSACWTTRAKTPSSFRWAIVPICAGEDEEERLSVIPRLREKK
ncbi:MAG: alginate lyase family protein, partial [Pyrinomonadaceae bacterium]